MHFELLFPEVTKVRLEGRFYDPSLDDIRSILIDLCDLIESEGEFVFSGFGQDVWPVDVATDLAIFLEQLPEVLFSIMHGAPASIDFYEQGIERRIDLVLIDDLYFAKCTSQTAWCPNPETEKVERALLLKMLMDLRNEFLRIVSIISPNLLSHPWLNSWSMIS